MSSQKLIIFIVEQYLSAASYSFLIVPCSVNDRLLHQQAGRRIGSLAAKL